MRILLVICATVLSLSAMAGDWPMWRFDAGRTSASPDALPDDLYPAWVAQYTPRVPVWDDPLNQDMMPFDEVFEPVVSGKLMVVPFNDAGKVVALDTDTGEEVWSYYVDGPVRFPAVIHEGKVFFVCEDGYLYCLALKSGALEWSFRGAPDERWILGNKRLISTWPARGAPVVADGTVYFAASIWPMMGIFIYALDAATGTVKWKNDGQGSDFRVQPHNSPAFAGVAPQGMMTVEGDYLLVSGGRSVPACLDRATGEVLYYRFDEQNKRGGAFVAARNGYYFNHFREKDVGVYKVEGGDNIVDRLGKYPALGKDTWYFSGERVKAYDAAAFVEKPGAWGESLLWELDADARGDLIAVGNRLYAAGGDTITAIQIAADAKSAEVAWRKKVAGEIGRLFAADDKLFAVTREGHILAFGAKRGAPKQHMRLPLAPGAPRDAVAQAQELLKLTGVHSGYALYFGVGDGDLLEALAEHSELHLIALDPDARKVAALRERFDAAGLLGDPIDLRVGSPLDTPLPPYMASLTIVDDLDATRFPRDAAMLARVFHSMRPYGGKAWFRPLKGASVDAFKAVVEAVNLAGLTWVSDDAWLLSREGALPGAGTWTHGYGDIANTNKSDDQLVKLPLGVLWFGGNSNMDVLPRHGHAPSEQVAGGRLFVQGMDGISARDVYTGQVLWKRALNDLGTRGIYFDETYKDLPTDTRYNQVHIPGGNIRGTNMVATADAVYILQGGECHVFDAATGAPTLTIIMPPEDPTARRPKVPDWGYLGVYEDTVLGGYGFVAFSDLLGQKKAEYSVWTDFDASASHALIGFDRHSGDMRWRADAKYGFLHNGTAAGNDMVFVLDKYPAYIEDQLKRRGQESPQDYSLKALKVDSGEIVWETNEGVFGSFLSYSKSHDILIQAMRPSKDMSAGEEGKRMIAYKASTGEVLWDRDFSYFGVPMLHGDNIIFEGTMIALATGEDVMRTNPLTGERVPWLFKRNYGCNYPIASEHLLTFRSAAAAFYDFANDGGTGNFGGFKSGCTANLVIADGVLNAPDYTRTCACSYQNQTSLAMVHMPETELWTFNSFETGKERVRRVGINIGAPGDRMADSGTLWLDFPSVGGPSPEVPVEITGRDGEPKYFRNHASAYAGAALDWVAASGVEDVASVKVSLAKEGADAKPYTVRLYFAEPNGAASRTFKVSVQGQQSAEGVSLAQETNALTREFSSVAIQDVLELDFEAGEGAAPVLSGIEVVAEW